MKRGRGDLGNESQHTLLLIYPRLGPRPADLTKHPYTSYPHNFLTMRGAEVLQRNDRFASLTRPPVYQIPSLHSLVCRLPSAVQISFDSNNLFRLTGVLVNTILRRLTLSTALVSNLGRSDGCQNTYNNPLSFLDPGRLETSTENPRNRWSSRNLDSVWLWFPLPGGLWETMLHE